tara:strand:+ start:298 stop:687 length:390 start_codon:yes stop_codon:yes gene_type:complete
MSKIEVDGTSYEFDELSDAAQRQYETLVAAASELRRLELSLAITLTARHAYEIDLEKVVDKLSAASGFSEGSTIEVLGQHYRLADFSGTSKVAIESIRACDLKINTVKIDLAIVQTGISAYTKELKKHL